MLHFDATMRDIAEKVLVGPNSPPRVVVGPVRLGDYDDIEEQGEWLFAIAVGDCLGFVLGRILCGREKKEAIADRSELLAELAQRASITVYDTNDDLELAQWCEKIWPGEKSRYIRMVAENRRRSRN